MKLEEVVLNIIIHSGNAKSLCFDALGEAKKRNIERSKELIKEAKNEFLNAHRIQTEMLQGEANGDKTEVSLLMVHAQDHLMSSSLAMDLIEEMIEMYETMLPKDKGKDD